MARKRPVGRPPGRVELHAFQVRIPPELDAALERARVASKRTKNKEVQEAIEQHLSRLGLWQPPKEPRP